MNPDVESWATFWKTIFAIGVAAYFLVALAVVPLGLRDIRKLFSRLDAPEE